ncbi:DNA topoisomerase I [Candidatus Parcubacteria bacterium 4484_255]|nr:MAG: DNA topoisomerase I [Candidatus Parcubacteria bacterium 4484_255]
MDLIIVESPTKAKTISQFLGKNFIIKSCNGHVRDLPKSKTGVDIEHGFKPQYVIPTKKRKIVNELKKIAQSADKIYFASDEDREGEAIAWHLQQILKTNKNENQKTYRISFHEITKEAIKKALKNPRQINLDLVNAQQARRVLDRLVGYQLSPLLWEKIFKGLSAGRVQSPTVKLIIDREKEIKKFKPQEYWTISAFLKSKNNPLEAKLRQENNHIFTKFEINSREKAKQICKELEKTEYKITNIDSREINKSPMPPFSTSSLQQEANAKLGFSAKQTMFIAQKLYEGIKLENKKIIGLITYLRTDSLNLSKEFLTESEKIITKKYGKKYLKIRHYKTKSKISQEAHEAIRPTSIFREPEKIKEYLDEKQYKLYNLIWKRAIASQMSEAILTSTSLNISASKYQLRAKGLKIKFPGWLKIYPKKQKETSLPDFRVKQKLKLIKVEAQQHFTEPPPRYNEASLVKKLEEIGIGRPSTYVPIISTIQTRNYVQKKQKKFYPTETGQIVNELLESHFPEIVNYNFTAKMENNLDDIAQRKKKYVMVLDNFYKPFKKNLMEKKEQISKKFTDEKTDEKCPKCGRKLIIKTGRFGKFLACSGFPECRFTKNLEGQNDNKNNKEKIGVKCPKCKEGEIVRKRTRKGKFFYGCSAWPKCDFALWNEPTGEKCPKCGSLMVKEGEKVKCSNKECENSQLKKFS